MKRTMTLGEAETKRQQAVEFLRRIGQDDDAERFEDMDARGYAEHKGVSLIENPHRRHTRMARTKSRAELETELDHANGYIEELEAKLDDIAGIAGGEDVDDDEDDDGEEDEN